ncbi:toMV resistance protein Tm-2(2)-like [Syzygium oleosum]|uniref:toMV resistance protein Tm-2(2)-like n=1 Tax=Syzygium oleosum TaxID=219896 RepID=UPI0024BAAD91|nr:toMV resistance protein Tm-2(2)-like [Syzygium oleosum]
MEASEGLRPRKNPLAKTLSLVRSLSSRSRRGNGERGKMLAREVETSPLSAGRSIVASSTGNLTRARKMKDESHIVGRENLVNELVEQLLDKRDDGANLRVISVVGEEAIGKTALVRSVYNRADIKNHFDCCAWVRVAPGPTLVHLMVDLLKQLRVSELRDVERLKKEELSDVLQRVLMECCYLIVLDDLNDVPLMDELIMMLVDSRNRSRVIVTTCNHDIPSFTDPWYSMHLTLSPVNREQSNELLESSWAFDMVDLPTELLHLKELIFSKSGGSPAKILLLGGLLSATTSDRCTELANGLSDPPTLQDVARLSVDVLPVRLKQCALYLAMFPKESEIPTRRLFRLWSAENLVSSPLENGVTRISAEKCFKDLVSRNVVHVARRKWDGSARSCRLPGTLYDVFYQMAKNERFLKIYDDSIHDEGKFDALRIAIPRHIFGEGKAKAHENALEVGPERSETNAQEARTEEITSAEPHQKMSTSDKFTPCGIKQLCSYVSFNTMKLGTQTREIEALLKPLVLKGDSSLLRVLDLEGVYKPLLPEELGNILLNLKYLGLRWTLLESLPKSVVRLSCLETLDLKYTNITQVPASIWEIGSLQHLYMNEVSFDESIHPPLHSKKSLNCNIQTIWGLYIGVESPMLNVLCKLTGLRKLALTCHPSAVKAATEQISNLKMLESLRLRSKDLFGQPSDLELTDMRGLKSLSKLYLLGELSMQRLSESHIPQNLKVLTLSMSGLKDDPMVVLGKLEFLTTLRLFAYSYDGEILSVSEGTFRKLRVLKLWKLENLTGWTIQANAMQCLEDLEIKECKQLKMIEGLKQITTLEVVTLVKVPDELERSVREMRPNVPIIAKELVTGLPQNEKKEEPSDEEDSRRGEEDDYSEDPESGFEEDGDDFDYEEEEEDDDDFNYEEEEEEEEEEETMKIKRSNQMKNTADEGEDGDDHSEDYKFRFQEDDFDYCEQDDSDYEEEKRRREEEETCLYERSMKDMILGGNSSYD